ncbi:phosphoglycerate mutase [Sphingomonas sp. Leaf34]|uniref:histidine phosphatase family protein n=1 Tax=Sphingomonas sp. Leaf34 TaxID=1736216 RepID=UPI0006FA90AD|nr:histidine phosphatase family protein [Sphingomonas sp. Leaf34]KQN30455.1 phosphoglycerate mutase [Sphingomonas sp. Leaf34]
MSAYMLYLMRHGAPAVTGRLLGRTDDPATEAGIAACVARADGLDVARIEASDLIRARACAEAVAGPRGLPVAVNPRWRELDFGAWDGLAPAVIDPAALGAFYDDPDAAPPPGGERWSSLHDRVASALAAMPPVPTLVVTHGGAIRAALADLCGFDSRQIWAFDLPYAALVSLRVWPGLTRTVQIVGLAT